LQQIVFVFVFDLDEAGEQFFLVGGVDAFAAGDERVLEWLAHVAQPIGVRYAVGVCEADEGAAGDLQAAVTGGTGAFTDRVLHYMDCLLLAKNGRFIC
jgi:hypothetical protein